MEVLTVAVRITGTAEVKGRAGEAAMLRFEGVAESAFFRGRVCPGGVDTQKQAPGGVRSLSARYILEGEDYTGCPCRIFLENNARLAGGELVTEPSALTDSEALSFLETMPLRGTLTAREGGVTVHIFCEELAAPARPRADGQYKGEEKKNVGAAG